MYTGLGKEGKKWQVPLCYLLPMFPFWLHQVNRSTVCGDGCFIRSAFGQTLVRALNTHRVSSQEGHPWCIFNYNLAEIRPNGRGGSPSWGLGSSPRGPPRPPNRLLIQGYQKCDRRPPPPSITLPTTLTRLKCWPTSVRSFPTIALPRASC